MKRFPLLFALALITGELLFAGLLWFSAAPGMKWVGNTIINSHDTAVYLSYLRQGADGHILLHSLFAVEANAPRFDLVWSTLGFFSRFIPLLIVQEGARVLFTFFLVFAVHWAARPLTKHEADTNLATFLAFAGTTTGFLLSIWLGASHLWTPTTNPSIDVASEFSIAPMLMGGAHIILSIGLLITSLRLAWKIGHPQSTKSIAIASACAACLFAFHPYYLPLTGVYLLLAIGYHWRQVQKQTLFRHIGILALSLIPAAIVYIPLAFDPVFRTHHLSINLLPLPDFFAWFLPVLPFLAAFAWRYFQRQRIRPDEQWLIAWIIAVLLSLFLPVPWKRKMLEGLNVALVFLSLPFFFALRDWARKGPFRWMNTLTCGVLLCAASSAPLHLFTSQIAWIHDPVNKYIFYQPVALFDAWSYLHTSSPQTSVVTTDVFWSNLWIPSYAGRVAWVAHDHETPDYAKKLALWKQLVTTTNPQEAQRILSENRITHLIVTSEASLKRFERLLGSSWTSVFHKDQIAILVPRPMDSNLALSCQNDACVAP